MNEYYTYNEQARQIMGQVEERPTATLEDIDPEIAEVLSQYNRQRVIATVHERDGEGLGQKITSMMNREMCPFCGECGMDLVGLKYHLMNYCDEYDKTETLPNLFGRR